MAILQPEDYPAVRAALDPALDATTLPDATIELPIFLDAADLELKRLAPDWADYVDEPEATQLRLAAIYLTASLIAATTPAIVAEAVGKGDYSYRAERPSPAELAALLRARAVAAVDLATGAASGDAIPTFFELAESARERRLTSLGWFA